MRSAFASHDRTCVHDQATRRHRLRVSAYLVLLGALIAALWLRSVSANANERALQFGRGLTAWGDTLGDSTSMQINGQEFVVTSVRSAASLDEIFARFAASCSQAQTDVVQKLGQPAPKSTTGSAGADDLNVFSFRSRAQDGAMFCFAGANGVAALADGARRAAASGDLSELGPMRYLFARTAKQHVQALLVTNRGKLKLHELFPDGDARGTDITSGIRPPQSVRVLSAQAAGSEHAVSSYRSSAPLASVLQGYETRLRGAGYRLESLPSRGKSRVTPSVRIATDASQAFVISAGEEQGSTIVSAVRLGNLEALARGAP
jgi:hypothetical protein